MGGPGPAIGSLVATLFAARTSLPEARQHKATSLATNAVIDWMRGLDVGTDQEPVLVQGGMETTLSYNKLREVYVPDGAEVTFVSDAAGRAGCC